jgi:hypothetical protein
MRIKSGPPVTRHHPRRRHFASRPGLVLGLLLTLGVAGCGSAGNSDKVATAGGATASSTANQVSDLDKYLKFAQCMRDNGIDVADPEDGKPPKQLIPEGVTVSKEKIDAAQEKCKEFAPSPGDRGGGVDAQQQEQLRQMAQCMRENGVPNFPDPTEKGITIEEGSGIDPKDPKFKAAEQTCSKFTPVGPDGKTPQPGQGPAVKGGGN